MFPEVSDIRIKRKRFNLTQKELAIRTGVSQSLIAKLESGRLDPSYSVAKRIFNFLDDFLHKNSSSCFEIMSKKVYSLEADFLVSRAVRLMKEKNISQIPIKSGKFFVGGLSEAILYSKLESGMEKEVLFKLRIRDVMGSSLPIVSENTPVFSIVPLLKFNNAVLIQGNKERVVGIITRTDLL
jgi:predicted transcriptional regulator